MEIIFWIIFGGLAGWIGSLIMNTNGQQGIIINIVVGIVGAGVGGFIMQLLGFSGVSGFNFYSLLVAVAGAVIFLFFFRLVQAT